MSFLVDANVLSEATRPLPDASVVVWLRENERDLAVNPIILGELEYGILLLPTSRRRSRLESWFAGAIQRIRIYDFDAQCGAAWARLLARLKKSGNPMPVKDSLIAATALAHGLTVATRNDSDFKNTGVATVNPFRRNNPQKIANPLTA